MDSTATIIVSRTSERDIKVRELLVAVGAMSTQPLRFGKLLKFEVAPGIHEVMVSNRLYTKRMTVDVKEGETVKLVGGNVGSGCLFKPFMVITGMGAYKVFLEPEA